MYLNEVGINPDSATTGTYADIPSSEVLGYWFCSNLVLTELFSDFRCRFSDDLVYVFSRQSQLNILGDNVMSNQDRRETLTGQLRNVYRSAILDVYVQTLYGIVESMIGYGQVVMSKVSADNLTISPSVKLRLESIYNRIPDTTDFDLEIQMLCYDLRKMIMDQCNAADESNSNRYVPPKLTPAEPTVRFLNDDRIRYSSKLIEVARSGIMKLRDHQDINPVTLCRKIMLVTKLLTYLNYDYNTIRWSDSNWVARHLDDPRETFHDRVIRQRELRWYVNNKCQKISLDPIYSDAERVAALSTDAIIVGSRDDFDTARELQRIKHRGDGDQMQSSDFGSPLVRSNNFDLCFHLILRKCLNLDKLSATK